MSLDIVLIQPESSGNIGSVARVMKNFSFRNLVLVDPCEINDEARGFSMHAWDLVKNAKVKAKMDWDSYDLVVGTTGVHSCGKPVRSYITPPELKERIGEGRAALVFGRESKGLSNSELDKCDCVCSIQTSGEYPIMNLSHAVAILLYELGNSKPARELATGQQISILENLFKGVIERLNYSQDKKKVIYARLRNVVHRSVLSRKDASVLIGLFKKIKDVCV